MNGWMANGQEKVSGALSTVALAWLAAGVNCRLAAWGRGEGGPVLPLIPPATTACGRASQRSQVP